MMTEREPIVSVVTPTFNRSYYLHYAIESVLAQTVDRFELLVIDDGSTDSTPELMDKYADVLGFYSVMEHQISSDKRRRLDANEKILLAFLNTYLDAYKDIVRAIREDALWPGPWRGAAKVALRTVVP